MRISTHNGDFHTDDIFAVAALRLLYPESEVVRSRDPEIWKTSDIVVDVGGEHDPANGRFDHHQSGGAGTRSNGIPYASFGLVWKEFGVRVAGSQPVADGIDKGLVSFVDANDNGFSLYDLNVKDAVVYGIDKFFDSYLSPDIKDDSEKDSLFMRMVELAQECLKREIVKAAFKVESAKLVEQFYTQSADKRIIVLDRGMPWKDVLTQKSEPLYVVFPVNTGWYAQAVPISVESFDNRKRFPETWGGKMDKELAAISGVADAVFCHNKGFLAVAKSREGALALAQKALEQ